MVHVVIDKADISNVLLSEVIPRIKNGMREMENETVKLIKSSFDNKGERPGNPSWQPVSFLSLLCRQTFPKTLVRGDKRNKAIREQYIRNAKPLVDTGKLRNSIKAIERNNTINQLKTWLGSRLDYAGIHEQGGEGRVNCPRLPHLHGKLIQVPQRSSHYINDKEIDNIDRAFKRGFNS